MNQNDKTDLYNLTKYFGDFWPNILKRLEFNQLKPTVWSGWGKLMAGPFVYISNGLACLCVGSASYYYNRAAGHNTMLGHNRRFDILVESRNGFTG